MLFLSHRKEYLVDRLAEQLFIEGSKPLTERWILLASQADRQWVQLALALRSPTQAIAGLQFLTWREALLTVCGSVPDEFELRLALTRMIAGDLPSSCDALKVWLKDSPTRLNAFVRSLSRQIKEAGFYGFDRAKDWQLDLRQILGWQFPVEILPHAKLPEQVQEIHCFCIDEMPPIVWDWLCRSKPDLSIYLFSPCRMFWEDLRSDTELLRLLRSGKRQGCSQASLDAFEEMIQDTHPLLANWGRLGRRTMQFLGNQPLSIIEDDAEITTHSFLQRIQQDLLLLEVSCEQPDCSLEIIAAGSSKLREVQILREHILRFSSYAEILVLAPDIRIYEPLIQFVFNDLPFSIASVAVLPRNAYCQALLQLFDLAEGHFDVDNVLELLENPALQTKYDLTSEDLDWFRRWLEEARVRGDWKDRQGNWMEGLRRMLLGLVYLLPEEEGPPRIRSIDWGQADRLEMLIDLVQKIELFTRRFRREEKNTLEEWGILLEQVATELLEGEEEGLFRAFLRKISNAAAHCLGTLVPFSLLREVFQDDCKAATSSYRTSSLETIRFASLEPGAIHPAKAIFLLGLDGESFPRKRSRSSFDWESDSPDPADWDRYLLLQALFAAKEHLFLSYCHLSSEDGKIVEPALPVQELMQLYSLQPKISAVPCESQGSAPILFWPRVETKRTGIRVFDLADFLLLARHPWNYFLQKKLRIFLKEERLFSEQRLNDFSLPPYLEQRWLKEMLHHPVEEVMERHAHECPPGVFGSWAREQLRRKAQRMTEFLREWGIAKEEISSLHFSPEAPLIIPFSEQLQIQVVGTLDFVTPSGLLITGDTGNFFHCLRQWPALLIYLFSSKTSSMSLYSLAKGHQKIFTEIDVQRSLHFWIEIVLRSEESFSPLIEPWADAFLRKGREVWKATAQQSIQRRENFVINWIYARAQPLPLDHIWEEWAAFSQEAFQDLIGAYRALI